MPYKDKLQQKEASHRNYLKYKKKYRSSLKARIERNRIFVAEYKKDKRCTHCPESRPACLQFHHTIRKRPGDKGVSVLIKNGSSTARILAEIHKCEILCANCHIMEHSTDL